MTKCPNANLFSYYRHTIRYNDVLGVVAPIPLIAPVQQQTEEVAAEDMVNIMTLLKMNPDNVTVNNDTLPLQMVHEY